MSASKPHYLLFCDGNYAIGGESTSTARGRWRFVLENVETRERIEATDVESSSQQDRTALLAVSRGLEALEQPSRVTLVTSSRYVARGLQYGLLEWRENDYCWEHFGTVQPIRNADLWKRIDRTLQYHDVQCRSMSSEANTTQDAIEPSSADEEATDPPSEQSKRKSRRKQSSERMRSVTVQTTSEVSAPVDSMERPTLEQPNEAASELATSVATNPEHPNTFLLYRDSNSAAARSVASQEDRKAPEPATDYNDDEPIGVFNPQFAHYAPFRTKTYLEKLLTPFAWIWHQLIRFDRYVESYLRCLFLLDPRRDIVHRRHFGSIEPANPKPGTN